MKKLLLLPICILAMQQSFPQQDFSSYPAYKGNDLGLTYTVNHAIFKIWSPPAQAAELMLYREGKGGEAYKTVALDKGNSGVWYTKQPGNLVGSFYTFRVKINGQWSNEVADPYAKSVGVNGKRAMEQRSSRPLCKISWGKWQTGNGD